MRALTPEEVNQRAKRIRVPDGSEIRFVHFPCVKSKSSSKNVLVLQGRASFLEKYTEIFNDLIAQDFNVWALDWRGQGGSSRHIRHPQKVHIDTYDTYLGDLHYFVQQEVLPKKAGPLFLLSSSMGATIGLRYLQDYPGIIDAAILIAPMFHLSAKGCPDPLLRLLVRFFNRIGMARSYVFGHGDYNPKNDPFETNTSTHDQDRFYFQRKLLREFPSLVSAGPTMQWLGATLDEFQVLKARGRLEAIQSPILILQAGLDRVVDTSQDLEICARLPNSTFRSYPKAKHGIHSETNEVRNQMWKDIAEFYQRHFPKIT